MSSSKGRKKQARPPKLAPRRQRFIDEYLIDLNGTKAAVRADYSPKAARFIGARLLANVDISEAVRKAMDERADESRTGGQVMSF